MPKLIGALLQCDALPPSRSLACSLFPSRSLADNLPIIFLCNLIYCVTCQLWWLLRAACVPRPSRWNSPFGWARSGNLSVAAAAAFDRFAALPDDSINMQWRAVNDDTPMPPYPYASACPRVPSSPSTTPKGSHAVPPLGWPPMRMIYFTALIILRLHAGRLKLLSAPFR